VTANLKFLFPKFVGYPRFVQMISEVFFPMFWCNFWDFRKKRTMDRRMTDIILEGLEFEKRKEASFFTEYLTKFSVIGEMAAMAIFDFAFLYFFSVSVTQLIKLINPEIVTKLAPPTPIRTLIISAFLCWLYYQPLRPLVQAKKPFEG
jgi:hypothetical protein